MIGTYRHRFRTALFLGDHDPSQDQDRAYGATHSHPLTHKDEGREPRKYRLQRKDQRRVGRRRKLLRPGLYRESQSQAQKSRNENPQITRPDHTT